MISSTFTVHGVRFAEYHALFVLHNVIFETQDDSFSQFRQSLNAAVQVWAITYEDDLIGYTAVWEVPGVAGLLEFNGGILPQYRKRGAGSLLLNHLITNCKSLPFHTLSCSVADVDTAVAHFLDHHHFWVEHEEWTLLLKNLATLPAIPPSRCLLRTYPRQKAVAEFIKLYDASFADTPWNQPFTAAEVDNMLNKAIDIKFLLVDGKSVGFAWVHYAGQGATLEPIGIVQTAQGKGYGRILLTTILHMLANENVPAVSLGVWANNDKALALYQSVGFEPSDKMTYLAISLK